jgi:hypothetical protein
VTNAVLGNSVTEITIRNDDPIIIVSDPVVDLPSNVPLEQQPRLR